MWMILLIANLQYLLKYSQGIRNRYRVHFHRSNGDINKIKTMNNILRGNYKNEINPK